MIHKYGVLVKLLHKIRLFDQKLQLTALGTVNKMDHLSFMDQKMGFSKKIVNSIKKIILFLTAYYIITITASPKKQIKLA